MSSSTIKETYLSTQTRCEILTFTEIKLFIAESLLRWLV